MACRPAPFLLLALLALAAAALPTAARARTTPLVVNKGTLRAKSTSSFVIKPAADPTGDSIPDVVVVPGGGNGSPVGDRSVVSVEASAKDGQGRFPLRALCTVVGSADEALGVPNLCALEVTFALGSVMSQGTLYERDGALSGSVAIVGGTGAFKGLRGSEQLAYDPAAKTGTVKFSVL